MGEDFEKIQTPVRVKDVNPDNFPERKRAGEGYEVALLRWKTIGPAYEAWKKGEDLPEDGTPLSAWGGLTAEQVEILKKNDIRTVEEIADQSIDVMNRLRFRNAGELPELAKRFLASQSSVEKDVEISELKDAVAVLQEALNARVEAEKAPKKRGRPPKASSPQEALDVVSQEGAA